MNTNLPAYARSPKIQGISTSTATAPPTAIVTFSRTQGRELNGNKLEGCGVIWCVVVAISSPRPFGSSLLPPLL